MSQYICRQCSKPFTTTPIVIQGAPYCQTCGYLAFQAMNTGRSMPMAQPFVPDGRLAATGTVPNLWKCQYCSYEYNMTRDHQQCQKCGYPNPNSAPKFHQMPQQAQVPAQVPPKRHENAVWTCTQCGCAFCLPEDNFCQLCGAAKGGLVQSAWQCGHCGQSNHDKNDYCNSCGRQRTQGVEVKVVLVGNKWICRCGTTTPVMITKCRGCGETNISIDRLKDAFGLK